jgi:hypothetical protein
LRDPRTELASHLTNLRSTFTSEGDLEAGNSKPGARSQHFLLLGGPHPRSRSLDDSSRLDRAAGAHFRKSTYATAGVEAVTVTVT